MTEEERKRNASRRYYLKHRNALIEKSRRNRREGGEGYRIKERLRRAAHSAERAARCRLWRSRNKGRALAINAKWRAENTERDREIKVRSKRRRRALARSMNQTADFIQTLTQLNSVVTALNEISKQHPAPAE